MSKERTSVSLDESVADYLQREGVNASGLVNELVKQHMNGGASEDEILRFRLEQVESELAALRSRVERKEQERDELLGRLEEKKADKQAVAREAIDRMGVNPESGYENVADAVATFADKAGMEPEAFWKLYTRVWNEEHNDV